MTRRQACRSRRGLAEVEFVTILPLLLMLTLSVADLGRGLIAYTELEQAAQEGAIFGSFAPSDPDLIEARVRSSSSGLIDVSDISGVTVTVTCPSVNEKIAVEVGHTLELVTPFVAQMLGGSIVLESRSVGTNFTDLPCTPT